MALNLASSFDAMLEIMGDPSQPSDPVSPIGLIGLGLLGQAFGQRLIDAGYRVLGYDQREVSVNFAQANAVADLALACSVIVIAVYSTDQVQELLEGLTPLSCRDRTLIVATTLDPGRVCALQAKAQQAGLGFVEFPVSGTSEQVRQGQALGLASGEAGPIARHRNLLEALTPNIVILEGAGAAARAKLAINLVLEINRAALAEGLVLARAMGLDPAVFGSALPQSAAYSAVMDAKLGKILAQDFSPQAKICQSLKDIELIMAQGAGARQPLPLAQTICALLQDCVASGEGDWDSIAVIRAHDRLGQSEPGSLQQSVPYC